MNGPLAGSQSAQMEAPLDEKVEVLSYSDCSFFGVVAETEGLWSSDHDLCSAIDSGSDTAAPILGKSGPMIFNCSMA